MLTSPSPFHRTDPENDIKQALKQMYINAYETGDEYRDYALDTLDALLNIKLFSHNTFALLQVGIKFTCITILHF